MNAAYRVVRLGRVSYRCHGSYDASTGRESACKFGPARQIVLGADAELAPLATVICAHGSFTGC
jgi:hypothetical protein